MNADRVLEVRDLSVAYGKVEAVSNANLDVGAGHIVTVIGPNGAGKTTLLAAIMGALPSNGTARGVVRFGGVVEPRPSVESMVARGMTLAPEKRELFGEMTVEDNLLLGGDIALGGKIRKRSICPFCKGEREVEGVDIYERPKEKNVTDQNQN